MANITIDDVALRFPWTAHRKHLFGIVFLLECSTLVFHLLLESLLVAWTHLVGFRCSFTSHDRKSESFNFKSSQTFVCLLQMVIITEELFRYHSKTEKVTLFQTKIDDLMAHLVYHFQPKKLFKKLLGLIMKHKNVHVLKILWLFFLFPYTNVIRAYHYRITSFIRKLGGLVSEVPFVLC